MNLDEAISTHTGWKLRFRAAMNQKQQLDAESISKDDCCELGRWLHGEGKAKHGGRPEFLVAMERHRQFHVEAGKVAQLVNAQQYTQVEKQMANGSTYAQASSAISNAIIQLRKAIG